MPPCLLIAALLSAGSAEGGTGSTLIRLEPADPLLVLYRAPPVRQGNRALSLGLSLPSGAAPICAAPCDVRLELSPEDEFFVAGDGMPASSRFQLPAVADLMVRVDSGSSVRTVLGVVTVVVAALALGYFGLAFMELAVIEATMGRTGLMPVVGGALLGSLALGGGGVALMLSGRTLVAVDASEKGTGYFSEK